MAEKRNNAVFAIVATLMLMSIPFRIEAADFYCAPQKIQLPYPGILSNHPLYVIKKIRDKILEQFITLSNDKLEYYLFESNKYFSETLIHVQMKNGVYATSVGLRSGNYLTLFISFYGQLAPYHAFEAKLACDFYSTIEFQITTYNEIIATIEDGELKKQLLSIVRQLQSNKVGFDNLLTTMNSKRINP
jgi:hypothetical protein